MSALTAFRECGRLTQAMCRTRAGGLAFMVFKAHESFSKNTL